ncbi:MAG: hypothetical protein FWG63_00730 [Defluviitaleaceae bacterium]|nr:hypothetical protein [Defluviitaleaceae bacterium]
METKILQQILDKIGEVEKDINVLKIGQQKLEQGQQEIQTAVKHMQEDITEIKEQTEITRNATNQLIEWADNAGHVVKMPFMDLSVTK